MIYRICLTIAILCTFSGSLQATELKTGDIMICNPGPGMSYENSFLGKRLNTWRPDGVLFVHFKPAAKPGNKAQPKDGECTWMDRVIGPNEPNSIRTQARNTLKVINAFSDNVIFKVKVLAGSKKTASLNPAFLMVGWIGGSARIK